MKVDEETEKLLRFAENLDFEQYLDDLEVKAALESARRRVSELEAMEEKLELESADEDEDAGSGSEGEGDGEWGAPAELPKSRARVQPLTMEKLKAFEGSQGGGMGGGNQVQDDARSVQSAVSMLSNNKQIRLIHSARSLQAVARQVESARSAASAAAEERQQPFLPRLVEEKRQETGWAERIEDPKIVLYKSRALRKGVVDPSNLPYMHRNPAI